MQTKATARVPFRTALKPEVEQEATIHERSVPSPAHRSQRSLAAPRRVSQSLCPRSAVFSFIVRSRICRRARDFRHRDISLRGCLDRSISKHACAGPRPAMAPERPRNRTRRADCLLESSRTLHGAHIPHRERRRSGSRSFGYCEACIPGIVLPCRTTAPCSGVGSGLDRSRQPAAFGDCGSQRLFRQWDRNVARSEFGSSNPAERHTTGAKDGGFQEFGKRSIARKAMGSRVTLGQ